MKKSIIAGILSALAIIILFTAITFTSCKEENRVCKTCKMRTPDALSRTNLGLSELNISIFGNLNDSKFLYSLGNDVTSSNSFKSYMEDLSIVSPSDMNSTEDMRSLVLYISGNIKDKKEITKNDLMGYLVYYFKNGYLYIASFDKVDNSFQPIKELSFAVGVITANDIYSFNTIVSRNYKGVVSSLIFTNPKDLSKEKHPRLKPFGNIVPIVAQNVYNIHSRTVNGGGHGTPPAGGCHSSMCSGTGDDCEYSEVAGTSGGWVCQTTPVFHCPGDKVIQVILDNGLTNTIDVNVLYNFRDNFLFNSTKGIKIAQDYYTLTDKITTSNLTLSLAIEGEDIITNRVMPICSLILSSPTSTAIAYDDNTKQAILNFINHVKATSTDEQLITVLNSASADVIKYANKSVVYIISDFKN